MKFPTILPAVLALAATLPSLGQQLPVPLDLQATYTKGTRSVTGAPGPRYWQNSAEYDLNVSFDPATRKVAGTVDIVYRNASPDSLRLLQFRLYPNLYQKGAPRVNRISPEDVSEGVQVEALSLGGQAQDVRKLTIQATNMPVKLPKPLAPGGSLPVRVAYSYVLNKGSHIRTGEIEPGAAFVAYFFPRIAVYDDLDGWNTTDYNGSQEFYNDFCTFRAAITVPRNFVVWATGDLKNTSQVLAPKYVQRLQQAEQQDGISTIIGPDDLKRQDITAASPQNTWRFEAQDVTDFVFATADHYVWQASSLVVDAATKRRTRVDAVYNPKHKDFEEVVQFTRQTVEAMSYTFPKWPFPYAHETVFDGLDQMEYPMMVNDNPVATRDDAITLTDHEVFHTMFPFYMGTNETKYGWMDEGWATIGEWIVSGLIKPGFEDDYGVEPYARGSAQEFDVPVTTLSTLQNGTAFFLNSYPKPALGYLYVKDLLGDELFTKALHTYIRNWHGKHPMPYDFFNSMNTGAGQNLNWFWQRWFFDDGYPDLSITSVSKTSTGYNVLVTAKGTKPVPVDLTVTFADGKTEKIHRTVAVWQAGNTTVTVPVATKQTVRKVVLGSTYVPDKHKADNTFEVK
ncbi:M1 family metallopeptidase [Hymenobacter sp. BT186]|uniref:M1 family metallopeptidase n=1 Tax=Hymenobacter telluris TaxID=2816474 RepID=A0A939J799_9BACT|nr:M1 family metallopeptidase [Hymenobacter telluris]MBO0356514.1 M1 family metallopeptidase [Hymenobacter telluris]MBW3372538.1 M1 family metallopeptidase [Hymenobacter norwichensis]